MRKYPLIALVVLLASSALAEPSGRATLDKVPPGKQLPLKGTSSANPCAAFGPGFVKLEGSDTCVKLGGSLDVGVGASAGGRR